MEENMNLWNKKMSDLTIRDLVVLQIAAPLIVAGAAVTITVVKVTASAVRRKFRRNTPIIQIIETPENTEK